MATKDITTREIKRLIQAKPKILNREIAEHLDISPRTVGRHVKAIRSEWLDGKTEAAQ